MLWKTAVFIAVSLLSVWADTALAADARQPVVILPSLQVPFSAFGSPEGEAVVAKMIANPDPDFKGDIAAARAFYARFNDARLADVRRIFPVNVESSHMGGVRVDVVTPAQGVSRRNAARVLINLHGGAFMWGWESGALVEAAPIAVVGGVKVVTVDYRMAPENRFPAASEDVASVYRDLLKTYRPENIGIYGCSAGGILTAESVAWFATHGLPRPGAVATLCGSGLPLLGDSAQLADPLLGRPATPMGAPPPMPYFVGASQDDPLVFPGVSTAMLARFPPTLLIAGGRDFTESASTTMHRRLSAAGVVTESFVFDAMPHAFIVWPQLPEAQEAYRIIARFFDQHLGAADAPGAP